MEGLAFEPRAHVTPELVSIRRQGCLCYGASRPWRGQNSGALRGGSIEADNFFAKFTPPWLGHTADSSLAGKPRRNVPSSIAQSLQFTGDSVCHSSEHPGRHRSPGPGRRGVSVCVTKRGAVRPASLSPACRDSFSSYLTRTPLPGASVLEGETEEQSAEGTGFVPPGSLRCLSPERRLGLCSLLYGVVQGHLRVPRLCLMGS